ncbi:MAG TPA: MFS transporter [Solirubrobacteraceae bacterium]|nr:MFS transporter [Solirubrobacteraceae bacterium]
MHRYRALLALPGARAPMLLSIAGSVPIGMFGLAILLLARDATGSLAEAGRILGVFSLANAFGSVAQGRLMDRLGQGIVLRTVAACHVPALVVLVIAAHEHAAGWLLAVIAVFGGSTIPQLPAPMRSLWSMLANSDEQRETAYAMVAIAFEVAVVTAPAIVALIVALASPTAAVLIAATLGASAAVAFSLTTASRRWRGTRREAGWLGPLIAPGMRTVCGVLLLFGIAFGVAQVAVPAFTLERGSASAGGLLLACLSLGSLIGGVVYGSRNWPGALPPRLAGVMLGLGTGFALLAIPSDYLPLAVLLVIAGTPLAPAAVICSTLLDDVAPSGTVTEAYAVMVTAIVAGIAAGQALGGSIVASASYDTAVLVAGGIAACGAIVVGARRRTLKALSY